MTITILTVQEAWNKRRDLRAESDKLCAEGRNLRAEGDLLCIKGWKLRAVGNLLYAQGNELCAEGDLLHAKSNKLCAEGDILFFNAVLKIHGNVGIKWEGRDCEVCGVKYFFQEPSAPCEGKIVEFDGVKYKLTEEK